MLNIRTSRATGHVSATIISAANGSISSINSVVDGTGTVTLSIGGLLAQPMSAQRMASSAQAALSKTAALAADEGAVTGSHTLIGRGIMIL